MNHRTKRKKIRGTKEERWERLWCDKFELLCQYKKEFGNLIIIKEPDLPQKYKHLRGWCTYQRLKYKNNDLMPHRFVLLSNEGFSFDPYMELWEKHYSQLAEYKKEFGTCHINIKHELYMLLRNWCTQQRTQKNKLSLYQMNKLDAIGFYWKPWEEKWFDKLDELKEYKEKYGNCNVPGADSDKSFPFKGLAFWIDEIRTNYNRGTLKDKYKKELEKIGFVFNCRNNNWENRYYQLLEFKDKYGHCNVPIDSKDYKSLGIWVQKQRHQRNKEMLPQRRKMLDKIGFSWNFHDDHFEKRYKRLMKFKKKYGHCRVNNSIDSELSKWCIGLRSLYNKKELKEEQINKLNELGFDWEPYNKLWDKNFQNMREFIIENGHSRPSSTRDSVNLQKWANHQRSNRYKMSPDRRNKLDDIGFDWNPLETEWNKYYNDFISFVKRHGHRYQQAKSKDIHLFNWILAQRRNKSKLPPEKIEKLKEINFKW